MVAARVCKVCMRSRSCKSSITLSNTRYLNTSIKPGLYSSPNQYSEDLFFMGSPLSTSSQALSDSTLSPTGTSHLQMALFHIYHTFYSDSVPGTHSPGFPLLFCFCLPKLQSSPLTAELHTATRTTFCYSVSTNPGCSLPSPTERSQQLLNKTLSMGKDRRKSLLYLRPD